MSTNKTTKGQPPQLPLAHIKLNIITVNYTVQSHKNSRHKQEFILHSGINCSYFLFQSTVIRRSAKVTEGYKSEAFVVLINILCYKNRVD